jgi:S-adenosylmethionine/arginine decarboxylase-like enzyme
MQYWGKHLVINAREGNVDDIRSKEVIAAFVDELVVAIDMVKYGPLWIERFATHDPIKAGISFIQMIETSNITGHFVDHDGDFYLDIFSCKDYDTFLVVELVDKYFKPQNIGFMELFRNAKQA